MSGEGGGDGNFFQKTFGAENLKRGIEQILFPGGLSGRFLLKGMTPTGSDETQVWVHPLWFGPPATKPPHKTPEVVFVNQNILVFSPLLCGKVVLFFFRAVLFRTVTLLFFNARKKGVRA